MRAKVLRESEISYATKSQKKNKWRVWHKHALWSTLVVAVGWEEGMEN